MMAIALCASRDAGAESIDSKAVCSSSLSPCRSEPEQTWSWGVPVAHTLVLMTTMRVTEAFLWPEPFADISTESWGRHYEEAFTKPPLWYPDARPFEWDGDRWWLNVGGHGLLGSELYLRARHCRPNWWEAIAFTTAASATWEYVFEANGVRPSLLDLWYTPLAGTVLGEARFVGWKAARSIRIPLWRAVTTGLLDPFGELERAIGSGC